MDGGYAWLQARKLGPTKYAIQSARSLNMPSAVPQSSMGCSGEGGGGGGGEEPPLPTTRTGPFAPTPASLLLERYNLLWYSSGHIWNHAYCAVPDRSGRFVISGADDYLVKVWDMENGQLVYTCRGHMAPITVVAVSWDNSIMASACTAGAVRLWRLSDGKCLSIMKHDGMANWLQFDGLTGALISAGDDGMCTVWDLTSFLPLRRNPLKMTGLDPDESEFAFDTECTVTSHVWPNDVHGGVPSSPPDASGNVSTNIAPPPPAAREAGDTRVHGGDVSNCMFVEDFPLLQHLSVCMKPTCSAGPPPLLTAPVGCVCVPMQDDSPQDVSTSAYTGREPVENGGSCHAGDEVSGAVGGEDERSEQPLLDMAMAPAGTGTAAVSGQQEHSGLYHTRHGARRIQQQRQSSSRGIFSWNIPADMDSRSSGVPSSSSSSVGNVPSTCPQRRLITSLGLPHIKDGLSGEPVRVTTLDICSAENLLATGCEDGIARLWRFNDKPLPHPTHTEGEGRDTGDAISMGVGLRDVKRADDLAALKKLANALHPKDYAKMQTVATYLICRLEGHMDGVTDVRFSHAGDRLLTGSLKDGTVRLWSFSKGFVKTEHIILNMNDDDGSGSSVNASTSALAIYAAGGRMARSNRTPTQNKPLVYNACWTCDDQHVVVVHSYLPTSSSNQKNMATKLRVYHSLTGKLMNSFPLSDSRSHVLTMHPLQPFLCATGGEDGYMRVWNIQRGCVVDQHLLPCPDRVPDQTMGSAVELLDAAFTPDGTRLTFTDQLGRVIVLGRDDPARYATALQ